MKGRRLKTDVEAQVFCDQPVATPTHRVVAAAIDGVIHIFRIRTAGHTLRGSRRQLRQRQNVLGGLAAVFALVSLLYGLIWAIAGRETAGMRLTDLQLITFDGFQVDAAHPRAAVRLAWLSFCSGGLGLLWAVADEENLTWHDHISKTFPAVRDVPRAFVRARRM